MLKPEKEKPTYYRDQPSVRLVHIRTRFDLRESTAARCHLADNEHALHWLAGGRLYVLRVAE